MHKANYGQRSPFSIHFRSSALCSDRVKLTERQNGLEISAENTKLMTNDTSGINTEIRVNGQKLETVTSFRYLGSVITDEGSKPEILSRIAQTTAVLTRLKPV